MVVNINSVQNIVDFIEYSERLKTTYRNSWLSDGSTESVAEHTWRMALIAMALFPHVDKNLNREKVLKMIIIHDLAEIDTGDIPTIEQVGIVRENKQKNEYEALLALQKKFGKDLTEESLELWKEFEDQHTDEAKIVKIIDKIEAIIQKYQMNRTAWNKLDEKNKVGAQGYLDTLIEMCENNTFLLELVKEIIKRREIKMNDRFV